MTSTPSILDANGTRITVGDDTIDQGRIEEIVDCDEHGLKLRVRYASGSSDPEAETELWPMTYLGGDSWRCDEVVVDPWTGYAEQSGVGPEFVKDEAEADAWRRESDDVAFINAAVNVRHHGTVT